VVEGVLVPFTQPVNAVVAVFPSAFFLLFRFPSRLVGVAVGREIGGPRRTVFVV
jgi:hypothetical protein